MKQVKKLTAVLLVIVSLACFLPMMAQAHGGAGISGNGTNGINIDIYSGYYQSYSQIPDLGAYAWGPSGCAWFASARVKELTGRGSTIYGGPNWYYNQSTNLGFSRGGTTPTGKALACYNNHVSVVEAVNGDTFTISEGGNRAYPNNDYCVIKNVSKSSVESGNGGFLGYVYLGVPFSTNQDPRGDLDVAVGGEGTVTVSGWAFDPDVPSQSIAVHIYVGGWAGQSGAESFSITANKPSPDVNSVYGISGNHRFNAVLKTSKVGSVKVYAYGINNVYGTNNPEIWDSGRTVTISQKKTSCSHTYSCIVTKKATFTEDGVISYKCTKCNYVRETKSIAKVSNVHLVETSGVYDGKAKYPSIKIADSNNNALPSSCFSATISNNVNIGTAKVKITLMGNYSGTKYLSYSIVPDKPANLKCTVKSTSSFVLTWNKVPGATKYYVYYYDTSKKNYVNMGWVSGTGATINNVTDSNGTYAVAAVVNGCTGRKATVKCATKPAAPEMTITTKDQRAYMKWNAVPGATKYMIYYKIGSNGEYKKLATTSNLSATVKGFAPGYTYYFRMLAVKTVDGSNVYSSYSNTKSIRF